MTWRICSSNIDDYAIPSQSPPKIFRKAPAMAAVAQIIQQPLPPPQQPPPPIRPQALVPAIAIRAYPVIRAMKVIAKAIHRTRR